MTEANLQEKDNMIDVLIRNMTSTILYKVIALETRKVYVYLGATLHVYSIVYFKLFISHFPYTSLAQRDRKSTPDE